MASPLGPGTYCTTVTDVTSDCSLTACYNVPSTIGCSGGPMDSVHIFINELSNGSVAGEEYVELLIYSDDCSLVDLRGFILDDNNGTFSVDGTNTGVAQGHIRFTNDDAWSKIKSPSMILVYNPLHKSPLIIDADDPYDSDEDGLIILPSSHQLFGGVSEYPSSLQTMDYGNSLHVYDEIADWNKIYLADQADALQVRSPQGNYVHGISYGQSNRINGGPDTLHLLDMGATDVVFCFENGDYREALNYMVGNGDANRSPGSPNNELNEEFIKGICPDDKEAEKVIEIAKPRVTYELVAPELSAKAYPNPVRNNLTLDLINTGHQTRQIEVFITQITGSVIYSNNIDAGIGRSKLRVKLGTQQFRPGAYFLILKEDGQQIATKKIIKL